LKLRVSDVAIERYRSWAEEDGTRKDRPTKQIKHIVVNGVRRSSEFQELETILESGGRPPHQNMVADFYDGDLYFGRFTVILGRIKPNGKAYRVITLYPSNFF